MPASRTQFRLRLPLVAIATCLGVVSARGCANAPASKSVDDLAASLGEAMHGTVSPSEIRWEPSSGLVSDMICGRWALFLAKTKRDESGDEPMRDLWRARVRLSPDGKPLQIVETHNLTTTTIGDDQSLVVRDSFAAFSTQAFGQVQSVTVLDMRGEGAQNKAGTAVERMTAALTNMQHTGAQSGIARFDLTSEEPISRVGLKLTEKSLEIDLASERGRRTERYDLSAATTSGALHVEPASHLPKRLSHWAVDTVRAVPWIGPAPIAWLEENVFHVRDVAKRALFKMGRGGSQNQELAQGAAEPKAPTLDTSQASIEGAHWPPPKITAIWKTPEPDEGVWVPPTQTWLRRVPATEEGSPSPFMTTYVRPDEERPYTKVLFVAMDMRQLDVDMEAGTEDPQPLTGPHGPGKLPRDQAILSRVVAAFNGAFKTEHGHYGMMVKKRVLLPPQPGAATVITTRDGRIGLGSWGTNKTVSGLNGVLDDDIVSFRQNLDALVDRGEINPYKRTIWGFSAPGKGIQTERSGLCVSSAGHLMYAWGDDVSANTLAKAMKMAGCEFGMHLDMNPYHTGFLFTNIEDIKTKKYKSELLSTGMEIPKERYIEWAPKDFFYVMVHDPTPATIDGCSPWTPDGGAQPAPKWMPGIWTAKSEAITLFDVEPGRATWRVRAGGNEPALKLGVTANRELSVDDSKRVLFALSLGIASDKHPIGLGTEGRIAVPIQNGEHRGALVTSADGALSIVRSREFPSAHNGDFTELPLAIDDGEITAGKGHGKNESAMLLGTTKDGRVLVAESESATVHSMAEALKRAGATRAVTLDRGRTSPFLHRAGSTSPPRARYDESVVYAIAAPLKPRAFRFSSTTTFTPPKTK